MARGRIAWAAALALAACAPAPAPQAKAAPSSPPPAAAGSDADADADPWSSLTWEEKHDQMTWLVHPQMAKLFQRFQKTEYPELTCRTCHGSDAEQVQYRMPHDLPPLDPEHMPDTVDGPDSTIAKFMVEEVTPRMADLLGIPLRDPRTGQGFWCFSCHPREP